MRRPLPRNTRTDTLLPSLTLVRTHPVAEPVRVDGDAGHTLGRAHEHLITTKRLAGVGDDTTCPGHPVGANLREPLTRTEPDGAEKAVAPQDGARLRRCVDHLTGTRSEEHTSELQSLMRISYAVFCLKKQKHLTSDHSSRPNNAN